MNTTRRNLIKSAAASMFLPATPRIALAQASTTVVADLGGLAAAVQKSREVIGGKRPDLIPVTTTNADQRLFAKLLDKYGNALKSLSKKELATAATTDANEVNRILAEAGSPMRFQPSNKGPQFFVVTILNVGVEWATPGTAYKKNSKTGKVDQVKIQGRPAFEMMVETHKIRLISSGDQRKTPIVTIEAKNGDLLHLYRTDTKPSSIFDKENVASRISEVALHGSNELSDPRFNGAVIPMVSINQPANVSWLVGMGYEGTDWYVTQAIQNVRFDLDPKSASVKTETVVENTSRSAAPAPSTYVIDGPCYAVLTRPGMAVPYFSAYVGLEDMKAPASWKPAKA